MIPNPGSDEALKQGCRCPVLDNGRGIGAWGGTLINGHKVFVKRNDCPLHGVKEESDGNVGVWDETV